jgi:1-pyrroline-5-carboxylate dehydrogenase
MDASTLPPLPVNEPIRSYGPGTAHRSSLEAALDALKVADIDLTCTIDGVERQGSGPDFVTVSPHEHARVLGRGKAASHTDAQAALDAARAAAPGWRDLSYDDRAAIFLKAANLLAGPWRDTLNAATMLGQSKTAYQAEIDAACELIDFWRFNVAFGHQILTEQPISSAGVWNRTDHRPLEGVVYAITPFNFTAIAGNLPTAPALMGNVVVWKPAHTQQFAAHLLMRLLEEAGLPPGVINMVTGHGADVSDVLLASPDLAGIHFTGSTPVFQHLWSSVGANIANYRSYPRVVGETGGKDFIIAHPSADRDVLRTAMIRGAFEFQGQKCSAASRAYIPKSIWTDLKPELVDSVNALRQGSVLDFDNFMSAVIDQRAFDRVKGAIDRAAADPTATIIAGGTYDDSEGWFIRPTIVECTDPTSEYFTTEYFGPLLAVYVYDDAEFDSMLHQMESVAPYALTGAIIAQDRSAVASVTHDLRFAAGNFYINDKPTGAVVGQQPFGGARASGTNDKAGAAQNLLRWTSTRSIKENFVPPKVTDPSGYVGWGYGPADIAPRP